MGNRRFEDEWMECHRAFGGALDEEEAKVALLASRGRTNERIGEELGMPVSRVKWRLAMVYRALGVDGRHALAEEVEDRIGSLREREEQARGKPADLRIVKRKRRRPEADDSPGAQRSAPDA